jgi:hypothetical protein
LQDQCAELFPLLAIFGLGFGRLPAASALRQEVGHGARAGFCKTALTSSRFQTCGKIPFALKRRVWVRADSASPCKIRAASTLREVISAYQKCVAETVQRFGGFVAKYMGDGVLVYFGYPQAHEDDAERAVRAGLELVAAVGSLKAASPLQTRVGIATGLVVVGDLVGLGEARERGIVGETPNLAARLQGFAEPNAVVIAESTRRLLGGLFELADLGAIHRKGLTPGTCTGSCQRDRR